MKLKYSKCYPDQSDIYFAPDSINANEALQLFQSFNWDEEVQKEVEHYSPSIDYIRIEDKQRIIFSGIGKGALKSFMVMFIYPNNPGLEKCFEEENYFQAKDVSAIVSIKEAKALLEKFLEGEDEGVLKILQESEEEAIEEPVEQAKNLVSTSSPEIEKNYSEEVGTYYSIFEHEIVVRILSLLVASLFSFLTFSFWRISGINVFSLCFGILALGFIFGAIYYERKRGK